MVSKASTSVAPSVNADTLVKKNIDNEKYKLLELSGKDTRSKSKIFEQDLWTPCGDGHMPPKLTLSFQLHNML